MKAQIVSFHCVLKNPAGQVLSSTFNRDVITWMEGAAAQGQLQGLVDGLQGLREGERRSIFLPAGQAYGFYDPALVLEIPRRKLGAQARGLKLGDSVWVETPAGDKKLFRVSELRGDQVSLDGNHPLAGQDLIFEIEATEARDATPEEIAESSAPASPAPSGRLLH